MQLLRLAQGRQIDKAGPSTIGSVSVVQRPLILIIMYNIKSSVTSRRSTIPDCLNATTDTPQDATIVVVTRPPLQSVSLAWSTL